MNKPLLQQNKYQIKCSEKSPANIPLVSIVMPAYNAERYVLESIYSVKAQTEKNWELIIVDDSSTDSTVDLVRREAECDERIKVFAMEENQGPSVTRNLGIEKSRGKFIAFLDADDIISSTAIANRIEVLQSNELAGASYCDMLLIDDNGFYINHVVIPPTTGFLDLIENRFPTSLVLLRSSLLREEGGFDPNLRYGEDWDLWLRLTRTGICFVKASGCKVYQRQYPGSHSRSAYEDYRQRMVVLDRAWDVDKNCKHPAPEFKNGFSGTAKESLRAKRAFVTAMGALANGDMETTKLLLKDAPLELVTSLRPKDLADHCGFLIKKNISAGKTGRKKLRQEFEAFLFDYYIASDNLFLASFLDFLFPKGLALAMSETKKVIKKALYSQFLSSLLNKAKFLRSLILGWRSGHYLALSDRGYFLEIRKQAYCAKKSWQPLVSIITPSYNQAEFIEETLDSVLSQDYPKIEHIVVDGSSTDKTIEILESRKDTLKFVSEPDSGQSNAVNKGIKMARGEIIGWLNSDDLYASDDVISFVVDFFNKYPNVEVVYGLGDYIDKSGNFLREQYTHRNDNNLKFSFAWAVGILQPCVFFRKTVFDKVGYLDENNHTSMDYEFWIRLTFAGIKMHFIDKKIAKAKYHERMKSQGIRGKQIIDMIEAGRKYYGFAHPRWINAYAKYKVTDDVQIVEDKALDKNNVEDLRKIEEIERQYFIRYNSSHEAMESLLKPELCDQRIARRYLNKYIPEWKSLIKR